MGVKSVSGAEGAGNVVVRPANEASFEDLQAVFGLRGYTASCQCQRFKTGPAQWSSLSLPGRMLRLRQETHCGDAGAERTSGLVAYLDGLPVGWCAVEPRSAYRRLPPARLALEERGEDREDPGVWALTCFAIRAGYRRRGLTRILARAAVEHAKSRGARALEGYPMITLPGQEVTWGELHVGSRSVFADSGFTEVAHPTPRRVVMRIDFPPSRPAGSGR
jgi:GNAT superfamily N-acetyltransferase